MSLRLAKLRQNTASTWKLCIWKARNQGIIWDNQKHYFLGCKVW